MKMNKKRKMCISSVMIFRPITPYVINTRSKLPKIELINMSSLLEVNNFGYLVDDVFPFVLVDCYHMSSILFYLNDICSCF